VSRLDTRLTPAKAVGVGVGDGDEPVGDEPVGD
jgi:hypothetical protein